MSSKVKTPRKQSEDISSGRTEPHHIGKHTPETLTQELFSLKNTKPMFRDSKWQKRYAEIQAHILQIKDVRVRNGILEKAKAMMGGEL